MTNSTRKSKGCLLRSCCRWGVSHHHLCFGGSSKLGRREGKLNRRRKGSLSDAPIGGVGPGEDAGGQVEAGPSM